MPSTRVANAVTDEQRQAPPASEGLRAPSDAYERTEQRDRDREDRKRGRKTTEDADLITSTAIALMDKLSAAAIARKLECDPRAVRSVIKSARNALASRAELYVELHVHAATVAAMAGDAKPAQWAIERIAEEGERIIDPPDDAKPSTVPTFTLGFVVGGMPAPRPVAALPAAAPIDAEVVKP